MHKFGIYFQAFQVFSPNEQAARIVFFGLYALQHRGQESSGIAASDGSNIRHRTSMGLVMQLSRKTI